MEFCGHCTCVIYHPMVELQFASLLVLFLSLLLLPLLWYKCYCWFLLWNIALDSVDFPLPLILASWMKIFWDVIWLWPSHFLVWVYDTFAPSYPINVWSLKILFFLCWFLLLLVGFWGSGAPQAEGRETRSYSHSIQGHDMEAMEEIAGQSS